MATNPFVNKPINELLDLLETREPGTIGHEQLKMTIINFHVKSFENLINNLRKSMEKTATSNEKLSNKIFWLNVILTFVTVFGVIIAYFEYVN